MKKLELKHLAAYLPYNLKVAAGFEYEKVETMHLLGDESVNTETDEYPFCHVKPILRPLSDLDKEIEVNGERFVPMKYFYELYGGGYNSYENYCTHERFTLTEIHSLYFKDAQKLLSWHFDIFGLIESGLAVDINTLKV